MSKKIDYLTTDPDIPGQNWVCLSFLTPELVKMDKNCDVRSVKVRGCYSSEEEAKKRCEQLQTIDGLHNVYVAPVGKWLPWCDDPEKATDSEYAENELNKLMKAYKKNQEKAKMLHEERKNAMVNQNVKEVKENLINVEDIENDSKELSSLQNELENDKNELNSVNDELEKAEMLYKQMLEKESNGANI